MRRPASIPVSTASRRAVLGTAAATALATLLPRDAARAAVAAAATGATGATGATAATPAAPRVIPIIARRFEFVPETVRVRVGEPVTLRFTAPEVPMGFHLADFNVRTDILPGRDATVTFTPDRKGRFAFACDIFCGTGHEDMAGTLEVVG